MLSVRLNDNYREEIIELMMVHKYKNDTTLQKLTVDLSKLADDIYNHWFATDIEKFNKLPKGWLLERYLVQVNLGGKNSLLYFNGSLTSITPRIYQSKLKQLIKDSDPINRRFPANHSNIAFEATHQFAERFEEICRQLIKYFQERDSSRSKIAPIIKSSTTTKQLINLWPETEPFVIDCLSRLHYVGSNLPSLDVVSLNKDFDLPVVEPID